MNFVSAAILGILQGLTEFLPVSSSGHLVIAQSIVPNFSQPGVLFDVVLHAGTLLAIIFYFRKTIAKLTKNYLFLLVIGTIPAALVGFIFSDFVESLFGNTKIVAFALFATGAMNYLTDCKTFQKISSKKRLTLKNSFFIGVAQAIAIVPGISRSGSTIFAGTRLGIDKKRAAEFSFLLSIPAVLGANVLQFIKYRTNADLSMQVYFVGFIVAFIAGHLSIGLVLKLLLERKFKLFSFYCIAVGLLVLFFV